MNLEGENQHLNPEDQAIPEETIPARDYPSQGPRTAETEEERGLLRKAIEEAKK